MVDLFPSQRSPFNDLMTSLGYDPANPSNDIATPAGIGNVAATYTQARIPITRVTYR